MPRHPHDRSPRQRRGGFTIIELLVVLAAMAILLSIAAPRYARHLDEARETVMRQDLHQMREALDQFKADKGRYPVDLAELVSEHYLREVPTDPVTQRADTWRTLNAPGDAAGIVDVHSGALGSASDGTVYATW